MRCLIAYLSYSGNTKEAAESVADYLAADGSEVYMHRIGIDAPVDVSRYDLIFIGTFTWDRGATPDEVKDFVLEVGYKPSNVAVFGTGDTQFGGEALYCKAAEKLAHFYKSRWPCLKIEQSPRGSQEQLIQEWLEGVLYDVRSFA
ncbi:ribonucleotide reductase-associated flavodoxin, putative [Lentibacillus persicus]|uniref:Ribonucleotide reductase-associated flavodoxin, putative n=1 Tax=Lentibacillus persicus TaxID=640948 RepID=A0A1I1U655_9BACI|nr:flavodoxin [Lentibacillus persicus]SFD66312.1 ribonucleotide reductase-associated flavodoxin, putative [Lentibacillus persicus]